MLPACAVRHFTPDDDDDKRTSRLRTVNQRQRFISDLETFSASRSLEVVSYLVSGRGRWLVEIFVVYGIMIAGWPLE